jgi:hypothetical protein
MNAINPVTMDHMTAVAFEAIRDPIERVKFFRAHKQEIAREAARRDAGTPLPSPSSIVNSAATVPMGLTIRRDGKIIRHIPSRCVTEPHGGLFGTASRQ